MAVLLIQAFRQLPLSQLSPPALALLAVCALALVAADASVAAALLGERRAAGQRPAAARAAGP